ncbi:hypothetical protein IHE45_14G105700 [Dioscorea alata]|uniref:Uncharacterized protein n=1 Tax=Dioscorea alata TaxID=55571 RepID=A0ACB7UU84_DIOAL|nr:hypothetical protein IHE45_14G105700 [Dioscorea alata]
MLSQQLHPWPVILTILFLLLHQGHGARCGMKTPTVQQTQVGFGTPPEFTVVVQNSCPVCPAIDVHIKCGGFSQILADPRLLKVIKDDDCVVNGGLPFAPLQKISFNYTHQKFSMEPKSWYFQCE